MGTSTIEVVVVYLLQQKDGKWWKRFCFVCVEEEAEDGNLVPRENQKSCCIFRCFWTLLEPPVSQTAMVKKAHTQQKGARKTQEGRETVLFFSIGARMRTYAESWSATLLLDIDSCALLRDPAAPHSPLPFSLLLLAFTHHHCLLLRGPAPAQLLLRFFVLPFVARFLSPRHNHDHDGVATSSYRNQDCSSRHRQVFLYRDLPATRNSPPKVAESCDNPPQFSRIPITHVAILVSSCAALGSVRLSLG
jgi:hypothetical protein